MRVNFLGWINHGLPSITYHLSIIYPPFPYHVSIIWLEATPHPPALSCWALCFRPKSTGAVPVGQVGSKITCHPGVDRIWNVQKTRYTVKMKISLQIPYWIYYYRITVCIYIYRDIDIDIYISLFLYTCVFHIYIYMLPTPSPPITIK